MFEILFCKVIKKLTIKKKIVTQFNLIFLKILVTLTLKKLCYKKKQKKGIDIKNKKKYIYNTIHL